MKQETREEASAVVQMGGPEIRRWMDSGCVLDGKLEELSNVLDAGIMQTKESR